MKGKWNIGKRMRKGCCAGFFGGLALLLAAGAYQYRCRRLQEDLAGRVLRFHVIANSNTREDQSLKLKVRDEIGFYLGKMLSAAASRAECEQELGRHLADIEDCARAVIAKAGYRYPVSARIENKGFPKKTYGRYTFPKGEYRALTVTIGEGGGENWWCVMYPNLCFSGSIYEVIDENAKEELRKALTEEEYAEIMAEGEIRVRLKYLDGLLSFFWQSQNKGA